MKTPALLRISLAAPTLALATVLVSSAVAQTSARPDPVLVNTAVSRGGSKLEVAPPEAVERGIRKLAGKPVQGSNGEKLGTIKDFVIDKKSGEVVYAVVSSGGALGIGSTLRLVPLAALQPAPAGSEGYIIKLDRVGWDRAPALVNEAFNAGVIFVTDDERRKLADVFALSDRAGVRAESSASRETTPAAPVGSSREAQRAASPFVRASDLRDKDIDAGDDEIGEIEDIIIDLESGRAMALVELEDDVIGREIDILMPLDQLDLSNVERDLTTRLTREEFRRLDPNYSAIATTPKDPRRDETLTPTGRAGASADLSSSAEATLASAVRSARQSLDNHVELARANITVTAEAGVLRLQGKVASEQQKKLAEQAVREGAPGLKVENQLVVR